MPNNLLCSRQRTLGAELAKMKAIQESRCVEPCLQAHYDLSNQMFSLFLSRDMTYSSGIFDKALSKRDWTQNPIAQDVMLPKRVV